MTSQLDIALELAGREVPLSQRPLLALRSRRLKRRLMWAAACSIGHGSDEACLERARGIYEGEFGVIGWWGILILKLFITILLHWLISKEGYVAGLQFAAMNGLPE